MVCLGQIDAVAHKANVRVQRPVLVDVFGIVQAFARIVFGTVYMNRRIAFVFQVFVVIITGDILFRSIRICSRNLRRNASRNTAVPNQTFFVRTRNLIQAIVGAGDGCTQIVFAVIFLIRFIAIDRKVLTHETQIQVDRAYVSSSHHFQVLHFAQILVVGTVRTHDTAPRVAHQVVVGTKGHLQHCQVLIIYIGITNARINVLVQFRRIAMPNEFTLVAIVLVLDIGRRLAGDTSRRRCRVPRKSGKGISKARNRRFKIFDKGFIVPAGVCVMATGGKFRLEAPAGLGVRLNSGNQVHEVGQSLYRVLQTQVHAPQHAGEGLVPEGRGLGRGALALIQRSDTKEGSRTKAVTLQREFRSRAQQQLVVYLEQGFAFKGDLDFLVGVQGALAQKLNLTKLVVHLVVRSTNKGGRTCSQLFCTRRNIHARTRTHRIARIRIPDANNGVTTFTHRFKIEPAGKAIQLVNRQCIKLGHGSSGIQQAKRL